MASVRRDSALFLQAGRLLLDEGYALRFRASGSSMRPTIDEHATLTVQPVDPGDVGRGDVVLYHSDGRIVAHRVVQILFRRRTPILFLRGDSQRACDFPIEAASILGKVVAVEPDGRVRRALRRMVSVFHLRAVAARLKRVTDWVPPFFDMKHQD
jgi:hypothetical protein